MRSVSRGSGGDHLDELAVLRALDHELHLSVGGGEQGVVLTCTNVGAGVKARAALAYDNVASDDALTAELLDSEALRSAIASVLTGSLSFLMGHGSVSLNWV